MARSTPERHRDDVADLQPPEASSATSPAAADRRCVERRDANGTLIDSVELEDGVSHGPIRQVRADGSGEVSIEMQRGVATGALIDRDGSGLPLARLRLDRGTACGPAELFQNGRPLMTMILANGVPEGEVRVFDAAGELSTVVPFHGGVIDGLMCLYAGEGRISRSIAMRQGALHGWTTEYAKNGEVASRQWFENGQPTDPPEPNDRDPAGSPPTSPPHANPSSFDDGSTVFTEPPIGSRLRRWLGR